MSCPCLMGKCLDTGRRRQRERAATGRGRRWADSRGCWRASAQANQQHSLPLQASTRTMHAEVELHNLNLESLVTLLFPPAGLGTTVGPQGVTAGPSFKGSSVQCSSVTQSCLTQTPWTAARQASLSITRSQSLLKLMSIESVMPSKHLIFCHPLLLLLTIFPNIRVFFNESALGSGGQSIGASASVLLKHIQG